MYKYELTMVNGEKFEDFTTSNMKEFISLVKTFSNDDMYMKTKNGEYVRCKYIASIKEIK